MNSAQYISALSILFAVKFLGQNIGPDVLEPSALGEFSYVLWLNVVLARPMAVLECMT